LLLSVFSFQHMRRQQHTMHCMSCALLQGESGINTARWQLLRSKTAAAVTTQQQLLPWPLQQLQPPQLPAQVALDASL
jgi:hypothetical protein